MFGKLFGKKKEVEHRDSMSMTIRDLRIGDFVDYDFKSWEIKEHYEYDWGNQFFTQEFKLDSGDDAVFVHLEDDDELEIIVSRKAKIFTIDELLVDHIMEHDTPMKRLTYQDKTYFLKNESCAHFHDIGDDNEEWSELVAWEYRDEQEELVISVERWGERDFEAATGKVAQEFEFSNFIPRQPES